MAGGAPIPIPTSDVDEKILSIEDLKNAASRKLGQSARGNRLSLSFMVDLVAALLIFALRALFCLACHSDQSSTGKLRRDSHILYDRRLIWL